jgi:transposase
MRKILKKTKRIIKHNYKGRDFRSLDENTQAEIRRMTFVNLDKGKDKTYLAELAEVNIQTIGDWIRRRKELESRDFRGMLRGRREGEKRTLNQEEEFQIKTILIEHTPDEKNLGSALWTRRTIQKLIKNETKHTLPMQTVGNQLYRWGLTPQRAGKKALEQNPEKIQAWIKQDFPKILEEAKTENAIIKFEDETGISLNTYYGKTYALKGKTPILKLPAVKTKLSMISSISVGGSLQFMLYRKGLDSKTFIKFLGKEIKFAKKKIYLITDNLRTHKSKEVQSWIKKHEDKIKLFFSTTLRPAIQSD